MTGSDIEDLIARLKAREVWARRGHDDIRVPDKDCAEAAEALSSLRAENEELRAALLHAQDGLNCWLHTYASDMCDASKVAHYEGLLAEGGTLAYLTDHFEAIRVALATPTPEPQQ